MRQAETSEPHAQKGAVDRHSGSTALSQSPDEIELVCPGSRHALRITHLITHRNHGHAGFALYEYPCSREKPAHVCFSLRMQQNGNFPFRVPEACREQAKP